MGGGGESENIWEFGKSGREEGEYCTVGQYGRERTYTGITPAWIRITGVILTGAGLAV